MIVSELRQRYPLKDLLKLSGIARSTYYYYLKRQDTDKYAAEKADIAEVFKKNNGIYGYRRITDQLRKKGYSINHKTVLKLMKSLNLKGKQSKNGKYHSYKGEVGKVADNIMKRDFTASKPFEKLTTDVTEFKVCNDKVYFSPVLDLFNREVVSYSISLSPNLQQVRDMLTGLFAKLPDTARPIFHSDQGWQYQHAEYQRLLAEHNITQSMSRKGNCHDNSVMENFFGLLKQEIYYGVIYYSYEELRSEIERYIKYYNEQRIKEKLGWMSPVQYRLSLLAA